MATDTIDFELYRYTPSQPAAALFAAFFAITTLYHIWQIKQTRAWFFTPFALGGIFQIIGYSTRIAAHNNTENVPIYAIHTLLILLAPPLYAASMYMALGRLITFLHAETLSLVPVRYLTAVFVTGDVVAFLMQAAESSFSLGEKITIGGLGVQLTFFVFFILASTLFHYRVRRNTSKEGVIFRVRELQTPSIRSSPSEETQSPKPNGKFNWNESSRCSWESLLGVLYAASILILIRSVFRLVEYVQGNRGYLIRHEVFMYVFDSSLMLGCMFVMNGWHPGYVLGGGIGACEERPRRG
ncbi:RTA1 domain protein [Aspergillus unguis]